MIDRRDFLQFLGQTAAVIGTSNAWAKSPGTKLSTIAGISPSSADELLFAKGLQYKILLDWRTPLNSSEKFGFNNDYITYIQDGNDLIMWTNHEYLHPLFINGDARNQETVDIERKEVGGSIYRIRKVKGQWELVKDDPINRRVDATTKIPFSGGVKIMGASEAEGTLANCAGGRTPWGHFLTCEENYDLFYGESDHKTKKRIKPSKYQWEKFYDHPPEHYGWVVEVEPKTGKAKKLVSLGRFSHECATCVLAKSGNTVAYSGEDKEDQFLYKFIASKPNTLEEGTLYVANIEKGEWIPVVYEQHQALKDNFKDQIDVLTYCRDACKLLGATPLARPEDIEINPKNGDIVVTLTNNKPRGDYHGQIMRIRETDGNYESLTFKADVFLMGGKDGFSCPDNMAFDKKGNLWFTNDIAGDVVGKGPYVPFKNNGLFVVPISGPQAGKAIQVASAPIDAEISGPVFDPSGDTLFLSIQHPGEQTTDINNPTSHWPDGKGIPRNAVVAVTGPLLKKF